jgi:hypothetical protein
VVLLAMVGLHGRERSHEIGQKADKARASLTGEEMGVLIALLLVGAILSGAVQEFINKCHNGIDIVDISVEKRRRAKP